MSVPLETRNLVFFFFFFKQKTANEIPKRDWSSDVCSSDLERRCAPLQQQAPYISRCGAGDRSNRRKGSEASPRAAAQQGRALLPIRGRSLPPSGIACGRKAAAFGPDTSPND